jgi:type I restriction enzyme S subunit
MDEYRLFKKPNDWRMRSLGECCDVVTDSCNPSSANGLPYLGLEHLVSGLPGLLGIGVSADVRSAKTKFSERDVLYGKLRPYLRKAVLAPFDGICSTDIIVMRAKAQFLPEFLTYIVHSDQFVDRAKATTSGVNHPRTSWNKLRPFLIPVPPLPEQRRIAAVLTAVQRAIEQQERLILLTSELKSALMHKLFTEGTRGEPQKQTEIGHIPESWDVITIGDIFKFTSGKARPPKTTPTLSPDFPIPVYGGNGVLGYCGTAMFHRPMLVLGRVGEYCGCSHLTASPCWISDNALYAKEIKRPVNLQFFSELLSYMNLNQYSNKMGQPLITQGIIHPVKIRFPEIDEQAEIAATLNLANLKTKSENRQAHLTTDLFRTLLHKLMTAQIRVDKVDLSELQDLGSEVD